MNDARSRIMMKESTHYAMCSPSFVACLFMNCLFIIIIGMFCAANFVASCGTSAPILNNQSLADCQAKSLLSATNAGG